jgi:hypothetical protein
LAGATAAPFEPPGSGGNSDGYDGYDWYAGYDWYDGYDWYVGYDWYAELGADP